MVADACSPHTRMWANALVQKGVEVALFSMSDKGLQSFDDSIKVVSVSILRFDLLKFVFSIILCNLFIFYFRPDIVHAHFLTRYGTLTNFLFRKFLVSSAWGSDIFFLKERHVLLKYLVTRCMESSSLVISSSQSLNNAVSGYTSSRRVVIPFGVAKCKPEVERKDSSEILIGCFKSLKPVYGIDKLISAYAIARPKIVCQTKLIIVGEGEQRDLLQNLIDTNLLSEHVRLVGEVPHEKALALHASCAVEVYPSKSEALGVSILEAMACGTSIIASDVGGIPEIISHRSNGILVGVNIDAAQLADIIVGLCNDPDLMKDLGTNAKLTVEKSFSLNICIGELLSEYRSLLNYD